jgi:transglutaminase-like putative cysteine protease
MTPHRLRLLLRDGSALAAFACMSVSGQLSLWVLVAFPVLTLVATAGWRFGRPRLGNFLLVVSMIWLMVRVFHGSMDLVVATSLFATLLALQRLHMPPSPEVDGHIGLMGILMVAGGAALSADLRFLPALLLYCVLSLLATAASVLEDSAERAEEPTPWRPAFPHLTLGVVGTLIGGLLLFAALPRLSWNVAARPAERMGPAAEGFSGEVQLSGGGLKTNPRPVLRVHLDPDPKRKELQAYWPGRALDTFDGQRWKARGPTKRARFEVELQKPSKPQIEQQIELLPAYGNATLVAMETPTSLKAEHQRQRLVDVLNEQVRAEGIQGGFTYRAVSTPDVPVPLRPNGKNTEDSVEVLDRYRELPDDLDPRVSALADRAIGKERDPVRAAERVVGFLRHEYTYSLDASSTGEADPLVDFLFVRKQGHCEHFATALALLLRTHGFATRVMTGFYGGERVGDGYVLRAADAHSWVQVWVPERGGFVTFDATPDAFRSGQPSRVLAWMAERYDQLDRLWRTQVVDYAASDQMRSLQWMTARLSALAGLSNSVDGHALWMWGRRVLVLVFWAIVGFGLLAWAWRRTSVSPDEAAKLGRRLARTLERAPLPLRRTESLEDYQARLLRSGHASSVAVPRVLRRYLEARFGPRPLEPGEARALEKRLRSAIEQRP